MNAATQLIPVDEISAEKAPAIYGSNILDRYVDAARAEVANEVPDLSSRKGRERVASLAAQVARSKTAVEKPGREYLKRIKELPKAIEAELRDFVQKMDDLRDEVRAPLNEWQAAEDARVDSHQAVIDDLNERGAEAGTYDADYLRSSIAVVEAVVIGEHLEEFEAEAARAKDKALTALRASLAVREKQEAEQAELAELRRQQAEREAQDERDRIAREAVERATREAEQRAQAERDAAAQRERDALAAAEQSRLNAELAEQRRIAAEQQAALDRQAAAERERLAAEQAERDAQARADAAAAAERQRQADYQAEVERQAKAREADLEHKKAVNNAALAAFIAGGMPEDCAKQAITLIAKRQIPNISITY